jgi:hypothetical protein
MYVMSKWDESEVLLLVSTMKMGIISTQPDPIFRLTDQTPKFLAHGQKRGCGCYFILFYFIVTGITNKTDKSKRRIVGFGRKVLTDKKLPPLFLRSIFIPTHHFLCFCLYFLSVPADLVGKHRGRRLRG